MEKDNEQNNMQTYTTTCDLNGLHFIKWVHNTQYNIHLYSDRLCAPVFGSGISKIFYVQQNSLTFNYPYFQTFKLLMCILWCMQIYTTLTFLYACQFLNQYKIYNAVILKKCTHCFYQQQWSFRVLLCCVFFYLNPSRVSTKLEVVISVIINL